MKTELESICGLVRDCGLFIRDIDRDRDGRPIAYDRPCSVVARNRAAVPLTEH